jgi:FixJ family two-component response regulator
MADLIRVALIDDDAAVLDSLALYLRRRSISVTTFAAVHEFLTAIAAGAEFDCVVSDVRMPDTSGLELRQALVDRNCTWPLLLITGHGDTLEISPRTVEHYREWVMERMQAASFAELVQMAMRLKLLGERKQIEK